MYSYVNVNVHSRLPGLLKTSSTLGIDWVCGFLFLASLLTHIASVYLIFFLRLSWWLISCGRVGIVAQIGAIGHSRSISFRPNFVRSHDYFPIIYRQTVTPNTVHGRGILSTYHDITLMNY